MKDEPRRHLWVWITYAALFSLSIPWYFAPGSSGPIWLGFPRWVTISFGATVAIALFTLYVIRRYWEDEAE